MKQPIKSENAEILRFYETSNNKTLSYWCTLPVFSLGYIALIFMKLKSRTF